MADNITEGLQRNLDPLKNFNFPAKSVLSMGNALLGKEAFPQTEMPNYRLVEEVFQNEYGVTTARAEKPVLVTYGLLNCVGLVGYNEDQRIGFVSHYQDNTDVIVAIGGLLYNLSTLTKGRQGTFKVKLVGGLSGMSEHLVDTLRTRLLMPLRSDIKFDIVDEYVLGHELTGRDAGIDTRTGKFIDKYDPLSNPQHREPYPPEIKQMIFQTRQPFLHYSPSTGS